MFFVGLNDGTWVPCGPKQRGAVQTTMQDLAARGLAAKVLFFYLRSEYISACLYFDMPECIEYYIESTFVSVGSFEKADEHYFSFGPELMEIKITPL